MRFFRLPTGIIGVLIFVFVITVGALAAGEEKHMHGADGRHLVTPGAGGSSETMILSHHDLKITDSSGRVLDTCDIHSALYRKGEEEPIHREHNVYEPENGVYGTHLTYEEAGEYRLVEWITMPDKSKITVEFPVWVYPVKEDNPAGRQTSHLMIFGGLLVGAVVAAGAYALGKRHGRGKSLIAILLVSTLVLGQLTDAIAAKEAHMHGADGRHLVAPGAAGASGPKHKAYPTSDKKESTVKTQDGYTFTLSIENEDIKPDADILSVPEDTAKIIGLKVEPVRVEASGGAINTTGMVQPNPDGIVTVNTRVAGRIQKVLITPGQKVNAGQIVATISSHEVAEAQADLRRALAEESEAKAMTGKSESEMRSHEFKLQSYRKILDRQTKLAQSGIFASAPVEEAKSAVVKAQGELREAKVALTHLEAQEARLDEGAEAGVVSRRELDTAKASAEQAKTRVATAEEQLELCRAALSREEHIQSQGLRNSKEVQQAESDVEIAESSLLSAKSDMAQAKAVLKRASHAVQSARNHLSLIGGVSNGSSTVSVVSPIAGEVKSRPVNTGESIAAGEVICEIVNTNTVWVETDVFEKDLNRVRLGQKVNIAADGVPGQRFAGSISHIGNEVNPETRSVRVRTAVPNPGKLLKPNMHVGVIIAVDSGTTISVPTSAVQDDGGIQVVFVEEAPGVYRRKPIRVGAFLGESVMVESGLESGDKIVTQGSYQLMSKIKGS